MIITLNIQSENIYFKIFQAINLAFDKLGINTKKTKGRPPKYSDQQIVACMIYGVNNSIFSLRELEYKIKQDIVFQKIIGLKEVPDHSSDSSRKTRILWYLCYAY